MQLIDLIKCIPYTQPISVVDAKSESMVYCDTRGRLKIWEMARYLNREVLDVSAYKPLDIPVARIRIVVKSEEIPFSAWRLRDSSITMLHVPGHRLSEGR